MASEDEQKPSFVIDKGLYYYKGMPFGWKNAEPSTIYQYLVNNNFKYHIIHNMEAYVDDMLVKTRKAKHHMTDLEEISRL